MSMDSLCEKTQELYFDLPKIDKLLLEWQRTKWRIGLVELVWRLVWGKGPLRLYTQCVESNEICTGAPG